MATGYTYTPLNASKQQIRVLCFDPSKPPRPDGLLECSLEHISLRGLQRPIYYAISYVWGNASAREELIIGGTRVNVPASSAAVLRAFCHITDGTPPRLSTAESMAQRISRPPTLVPAIRTADAVLQASLEIHRRLTYHQAERQRRSYPIVRLWLDAVCINQSDEHERSQQVAMMHQVYSKAYEVLIWLGPRQPSTDQAIASIHLLTAQCRAQTRGLKDLNSTVWHYAYTKGYMIGDPHFSDEPLPKDIDWSALADFYDSPWFHRVWVVHEAINARRARCFYGGQTVTLYDMGLAAVWAVYRQYARPSQYLGYTHSGIGKARELWNNTKDGRSFHGLMCMTRWLDATEPRDRIYAVLGLIRFYGFKDRVLPHHYYPVFPPKMFRVGRMIADFRPDYTRSRMDTFRMTALAHIWLNTDLAMFEWLNVLEDCPDDDWPSWVPRYDDAKALHILNRWHVEAPDPITQLPKPLSARPDFNVSFERHFNDLNSKMLRVSGVPVGKIIGLSCLISEKDIDTLPSERSIAQRFNDPQCQHHSGKGTGSTTRRNGGLHCALSTALQGSQRHSTEPRELGELIPLILSLGHPDLPILYGGAPKRFRKVNWLVFCGQDQADEPLNLSFECQIRPQSRLFYTDSGRIGLASPKVQIGDLVCILFGSLTLHVLRDGGSSTMHVPEDALGKEQVYRHVGKAHIPGIMEGQYIKQLKESRKMKSETRIFTLC